MPRHRRTLNIQYSIDNIHSFDLATKRQRLDVLLVERRLAPSRQRARAMIMAGKVLVDGRPVNKAGFLVPATAGIVLKEKDIPYKFRDHAWFTCYAPAENPEIAVTVLVEHGLHGSSGAAPIAKAILETYFADRLVEKEDKVEK